MKGLLIALVLALAACSTQPTSLPANLTSTEALAINGGELFIADTQQDELRVLALVNDGGARFFESAPNPIYVLSVPVATRPVALTSDTDGHGLTGSFVFSLSTVASRLGVVVAADKREEAEVV